MRHRRWRSCRGGVQGSAGNPVFRGASLTPDLVSIAAGGNDLLRPGVDPDALAAVFEQAVTAYAGPTVG
jgi:lysophospholipase L1-like esterase